MPGHATCKNKIRLDVCLLNCICLCAVLQIVLQIKQDRERMISVLEFVDDKTNDAVHYQQIIFVV